MVSLDDRGFIAGLARAGLIFRQMADPSLPLIPPTLATVATCTPAGEGWEAAMLGRDLPDLVERANAEWYRLSVDGGLFDEGDPRFLVAVNCAAEDELRVWRWAEVGLSGPWDLAGVGSATGLLGNGHGNPAFVLLSLPGDVIVRGDTWERDIGAVLVREPYRHYPFREYGEWMTTWRDTGEWEKAAVRR